MSGANGLNNFMWKLDLLEAKFNDANPRFPTTKKLLQAKNNKKLLKRLPDSAEAAQEEIGKLKSLAFARKYHAAVKKLRARLYDATKDDIAKLKNSKDKESVVEFLNERQNINYLIESRLVKIIITVFLTNKQLKENPPTFIMKDIREIIVNKENVSNPSTFFIKFCKDNKNMNNYISSIWNSKAVKSILGEIDWSFRTIRGNLTKKERDERKIATGKLSESEVEDLHDKTFETTNDNSNNGSDIEGDANEHNESEAQEDDVVDKVDAENAFELFSAYDNMIGDSDREEEDEGGLDPKVNYNEVTDEEPSESDDNDEEESSGEEDALKNNLPELASGYYSGGSDDESDDLDGDEVVKEATGPQRKNRRGQRARQKIWAKKFGKEANHVIKQKEIAVSERERRRLEFEQRQRKREAKMNEASATSANTTVLGERKTTDKNDTNKTSETKYHPSWEAKKKQEEKLKNIKFTGKKITFD